MTRSAGFSAISSQMVGNVSGIGRWRLGYIEDRAGTTQSRNPDYPDYPEGSGEAGRSRLGGIGLAK
jgi:hypothetical protein